MGPGDFEDDGFVMTNGIVDDVIDGEVGIFDVVAEDVEEGDFVEDKSKDVFSEVWE